MAERATPLTEPFPQIDPQRLAWGVLLIAFAVFSVLCVITGIGLNYFLFQSSIPVDTSIQVGRGTVSINGNSERGVRGNLNADTFSTDLLSQATLFFRDSYRDSRLIAAITLRGNSSLDVRQAMRPRFDWSTNSYRIEVRLLNGTLDVFIPGNLERGLQITLTNQQGARVDLISAGQYVISMNEARLQVVNREGQVLLTPANTNVGRSIPIGSQGVLQADNVTEVQIVPAYFNLLENSNFEDIFQPAGDGSAPGLARGWACTIPPSSDFPRGAFRAEVWDGRDVLRLVRGENATSHGETRCGKWWGQVGYDVSGFSSLALRVSFNLQYQSLSTCGHEGSECPLMLQIDYLDQNGRARQWWHGFYYYRDEARNDPLLCLGCIQEHDRVNEKVWYTYESDNLFRLLPLDQLPARILNVQFYASGHQYDVLVGEVALLAAS